MAHQLFETHAIHLRLGLIRLNGQIRSALPGHPANRSKVNRSLQTRLFQTFHTRADHDNQIIAHRDAPHKRPNLRRHFFRRWQVHSTLSLPLFLLANKNLQSSSSPRSSSSPDTYCSSRPCAQYNWRSIPLLPPQYP